MKRAAVFALLFLLLLASRLAHRGILWAEEDLPMAAAAEMRDGRTIYRDFWFDKPPLLPALYLAWGVRDGVPLRVAGAVFGLLACWLAYLAAAGRWGESEGLVAACLLAFFLIFGLPSAVMPLAADLTMVAPHLAAILFAWRGRPYWAGVAAGVAVCLNLKGLFVLAAAAIWTWRAAPWLAAGFATPLILGAAWMGATGALGAFYEQVWVWGRVYAADTFVERPWQAVLARTANWAGLHNALVLGAAWFLWEEKSAERRRWILWILVSAAAVTLGWRFFPRYYFQLLPPMVLAAAAGLWRRRDRRILVGFVLLSLAIPLVRFLPRYILLATGRSGDWSDTALDRDCRDAAALVRAQAGPGDTLFVWGFRPSLFVLTGLRAGTPYLDSQPLTGVPADRHLSQSRNVMPEVARRHREIVTGYSPDFLIDGLGPYNPDLAITGYPDLQEWLGHYEEAGRTAGAVIYRRKR
ncbi:MAG: hypothetical protein IPM24_13835 [Bryobacterales bacterium]|nr:hypothetical protein [Bryobacterales bacterium]